MLKTLPELSRQYVRSSRLATRRASEKTSVFSPILRSHFHFPSILQHSSTTLMGKAGPGDSETPNNSTQGQSDTQDFVASL